jgi:hypothetical protein
VRSVPRILVQPRLARARAFGYSASVNVDPQE